jgi:hypothetical protein
LRKPTKSSQGFQPPPKKPLRERMSTKPLDHSPCSINPVPLSPQLQRSTLWERLSGHSQALLSPQTPSNRLPLATRLHLADVPPVPPPQSVPQQRPLLERLQK